MFSRKKKQIQIDAQQRELYEHARKRIIQKKRLFQHFILFVVGSVFLAIFNLALGLGKDFTFFNVDWYVVVILFWTFLWIMHFCNVWLFHKFMGEEWTNRQMERLVAKQQLEISKIQREVDLMHPKEELSEKKATMIKKTDSQDSNLSQENNPNI